MIYSASASQSKNKNIPKKKYANIKDQFSEEVILRVSIHNCMLISTIKQKIQQKIGGVGGIAKIRLRYKQQLLQNNNASVAEYNIKNESTLYYSTLLSIDCVGMIHPYTFEQKMNKSLYATLAEIKKALNSKIIPKLTESGISGSYFLENVERNNIAIFKPLDEEPYAPNNPKGYVGKLGQRGIRSGIRSGEQGYREVVAYLLDSEGYHGVPPTTFVEFYHPSFKFNQNPNPNSNTKDVLLKRPSFIDLDKNLLQQKVPTDFNFDQIKRGSLQIFVKNTDECGNYGNSIFPIDEVHKIAILDIRILNCDRNDQNILVKKKKKKKCTVDPQELKKLPNYKKQLLEYDFQMIPIDHGLSLPDSFEICQDDLNWMWWEQSEQNFSEKSLEYIKSIDIEYDLKILQNQFNLREECLRSFRIANIVLKKGASSGLTLKEIGNIIYREDTEIESTVEKLISNAQHYAQICINGGNSDIIKKKIQKDIAKNNLKRSTIEMPSIQENFEEHTEFGKFCKLIQDEKNGNLKDLSKEDLQLLNSTPNFIRAESYCHMSNEVTNNHYLNSIPNLKNEKNSSSSISNNLKIKRSISLPDLQSIKIKNQLINFKQEEKTSKNLKKQLSVKFNDENEKIHYHKNGNVQQSKGDLSSKNTLLKKSEAQKLKKQQEDIFFYYFENVLDMHIEKIINEKENLKGRVRGRLNSEELIKQSMFQYNL